MPSPAVFSGECALAFIKSILLDSQRLMLFRYESSLLLVYPNGTGISTFLTIYRSHHDVFIFPGYLPDPPSPVPPVGGWLSQRGIEQAKSRAVLRAGLFLSKTPMTRLVIVPA